MVEVKNTCTRVALLMEFQILEDKAANSPLPRLKLIDLIETCYVSTLGECSGDTSLVVDVFLKKLLEQLNKHSTQYKYVVSMTSLSGNASGDQVEINNAVSASWNSKKDGLFNYTLNDQEPSGKQYLVTLIWISK